MEYIEYLKHRVLCITAELLLFSLIIIGAGVLGYSTLEVITNELGYSVWGLLWIFSPIVTLLIISLGTYTYYTLRYSIRIESVYRKYTESEDYLSIVSLGDIVVEVAKNLKQYDKGSDTLIGLNNVIRGKHLSAFRIAMLTEYLKTQNVRLYEPHQNKLGFMYGEREYKEISIVV